MIWPTKRSQMTTYHVDSEAVRLATEHANATIARVQSDMHQLTSHLQALQSSWTGHAATAFQSVLAEWRQTELAVENQLVQITQSLGFAAQHYLEMEMANARLFVR
jgi:early secretory antigenic target protein ESAT-6